MNASNPTRIVKNSSRLQQRYISSNRKQLQGTNVAFPLSPPLATSVQHRMLVIIYVTFISFLHKKKFLAKLTLFARKKQAFKSVVSTSQ